MVGILYKLQVNLAITPLFRWNGGGSLVLAVGNAGFFAKSPCFPNFDVGNTGSHREQGLTAAMRRRSNARPGDEV